MEGPGYTPPVDDLRRSRGQSGKGSMFPFRTEVAFEISILFPHAPSWPSLVFPAASKTRIAGVAGI